jgi:hypothetical protein
MGLWETFQMQTIAISKLKYHKTGDKAKLSPEKIQ